jgi:hypothetical protein
VAAGAGSEAPGFNDLLADRVGAALTGSTVMLALALAVVLVLIVCRSKNHFTLNAKEQR